MTPLDFNILMGIGFGGQKLELIPGVHTRLDEVRKWLGVFPKDVVIMAEWFYDTYASKIGFSDD